MDLFACKYLQCITSFIFQCDAEFSYLLVVLVSLYGGKLCMCVCVLTHVQLFAALWTVTRQALLTIKFSRDKYWSGFPFPSPVDLPNPGIKPTSLMFPALTGRFFTTSPTWEAQIMDNLVYYYIIQVLPTVLIQWVFFGGGLALDT